MYIRTHTSGYIYIMVCTGICMFSEIHIYIHTTIYIYIQNTIRITPGIHGIKRITPASNNPHFGRELPVRNLTHVLPKNITLPQNKDNNNAES